MPEARTEPKTLVGLWLLAMSHREPERRGALREQIDQKEGWTRSDVGVVEAAFELGMQAYFGNRTKSRHIRRFIDVVKHSFSTPNVEDVDIELLLSAALTSTAGLVTGISVGQRLSLYSIFFVAGADRLQSPRDDACWLIKEGELVAIARGWLPAMAEP